jgi:hypothetical protein
MLSGSYLMSFHAQKPCFRMFRAALYALTMLAAATLVLGLSDTKRERHSAAEYTSTARK